MEVDTTNWLDIGLKVLAFIGTMATAAMVTPNKSKHKPVQLAWDVINMAGANMGNAKNRD